MAWQRKQKGTFQEAHSTPLVGQLGREVQGLKKSRAEKSHTDVACLGNLQIFDVLEITLRMCPFKLLLLDMVDIQVSKNAARSVFKKKT